MKNCIAKLIAILLVMVGVCYSSSCQSVSWKTFLDPRSGVSFQYPNTWTHDEKTGPFGGHPGILIDSSDTQTNRLIAAVRWVEKTGIPESPEAGDDEFIFAILGSKTAQSCRKRALAFHDSAAPFKSTLTIHGVTYSHGIRENSGLEQTEGSEVYTTFRNGRCYGFEVASYSRHVEGYDEEKKVDHFDPTKIMATVRFAEGHMR